MQRGVKSVNSLHMKHFGSRTAPWGQFHYGECFFSKTPLTVDKGEFCRDGRLVHGNDQFAKVLITAPGTIVGNAVFDGSHWAIVIGVFE